MPATQGCGTPLAARCIACPALLLTPVREDAPLPARPMTSCVAELPRGELPLMAVPETPKLLAMLLRVDAGASGEPYWLLLAAASSPPALPPQSACGALPCSAAARLGEADRPELRRGRRPVKSAARRGRCTGGAGAETCVDCVNDWSCETIPGCSHLCSLLCHFRPGPRQQLARAAALQPIHLFCCHGQQLVDIRLILALLSPAVLGSCAIGGAGRPAAKVAVAAALAALANRALAAAGVAAATRQARAQASVSLPGTERKAA